MEKYRIQLDKIDEKMLCLFLERLAIVENIANYKKEHNLKILDQQREQDMINKGLKKIKRSKYKQYYKQFIDLQLQISKDLQNQIIK